MVYILYPHIKKTYNGETCSCSILSFWVLAVLKDISNVFSCLEYVKKSSIDLFEMFGIWILILHSHISQQAYLAVNMDLSKCIKLLYSCFDFFCWSDHPWSKVNQFLQSIGTSSWNSIVRGIIMRDKFRIIFILFFYFSLFFILTKRGKRVVKFFCNPFSVKYHPNQTKTIIKRLSNGPFIII